MIMSRLSADAKTTIPRAVLEALDLREGDEIAYVIEGGHVVLTRADSNLVEDPFATFTEWHSEADHKAYDKL